MLNINPVPAVDTKPTDMKPADLIRNRYQVCLNLVREMIDFEFTTQNKKDQLRANALRVADKMIETYGFGGKFIDDIERHIISKFQTNFNEAYERLGKGTNVRGITDVVMKDLVANGIDAEFVPQFKEIFK